MSGEVPEGRRVYARNLSEPTATPQLQVRCFNTSDSVSGLPSIRIRCG